MTAVGPMGGSDFNRGGGLVAGRSRVLLIGLVALGSIAGPFTPGSVRGADDGVNDAIDIGVEYLLEEIERARVEGDKFPAGHVALETYALIVAGVSLKHPVVRGNLDWLEKQRTHAKAETYTLACYIMALDAAISQVEEDLFLLAPAKARKQFKDDPRIGREFRGTLERAVKTLASLQVKQNGAWSYGKQGKDVYDHSNTQFAVLGLGVGAKRGVDIDKEVWHALLRHFIKTQAASGPETERRITLLTPTEKEERENEITLIPSGRKKRSGKDGKSRKGGKKRGGTVVVDTEKLQPPAPEVGLEGIKVFTRGWAYNGNEPATKPTWNMSCAGLSSLILARRNLKASLEVEEAAALNKAIRDGYGWLMQHWQPVASWYGIYSLEKVADLGEVKLFHEFDWYEQVSRFLIQSQRNDGSWVGGKSHGESPRVATAFALLVLNRATSLITGNPMSRIVLSGQKSVGEAEDRSWVYVPKLRQTMHYPTLMRHIRMRPNRKLFDLLHDIVTSYPAEWKGELIPELARVREEMDNRSAQKRVEKYLAAITGVVYEDYEDYLKWHRRWLRVTMIGEQKRTESVPDLLTYFKTTRKSVGLRQSIMWALVRCNAREALPLFLDSLEDPEMRIRASAYESFKSFYIGGVPSFRAKASEEDRAQQIEALRKFYRKEEARLRKRA